MENLEEVLRRTRSMNVGPAPSVETVRLLAQKRRRARTALIVAGIAIVPAGLLAQQTLIPDTRETQAQDVAASQESPSLAGSSDEVLCAGPRVYMSAPESVPLAGDQYSAADIYLPILKLPQDYEIREESPLMGKQHVFVVRPDGTVAAKVVLDVSSGRIALLGAELCDRDNLLRE